MNKLEEAVCFAVEKHTGQMRKLMKMPYILHPMEAAVIAGTLSDRWELIAAAALHDTVEDAGATLEEIRERFGERVAFLVASETEDKRAERPPEDTWRLRKEESLAFLRDTKDLDIKKLWLSDKLSNMRSFYNVYRKEGDSFWQIFNQKDPFAQKWYYQSVADCLSELADTEAYQEYVRLLNVVFEKQTGGKAL